mmetsp:Transcript_25135/g.17800  ORF Transcript_25135/g.17800 Transcript_25135/m.17800 type:complete len:119 (+) Transcript_25135:1035-1391(+)
MWSLTVLFIAVLPDLLTGTEKQIRLENIKNGEPNKPISIQLEDKAQVIGQAVIMLPLATGPAIGGYIYDQIGFPYLVILCAIINVIVLVAHIIVIYFYNTESNVLDYFTIDGTRPVEK